MTATLVEHAQYVDDAGIPLSGGEVFIGTNGADPVATAPVTTIFSDRELTVAIANPQPLESDGRSENKIWVSGKYSIQVNDLANVQKFQDLDAGSSAGTSNTTLFVTDIIGGTTITGVTADPISAYTVNQIFLFQLVSGNPGAVTLDVDGVGPRAVVKNNSEPLVLGDFLTGKSVAVMYNATSDNFNWINQKNKVVDFYEGSAVASAATTNIWAIDGNTIHVTGTTGITSFGTAPNVGARRLVIFDGAVTLTNSANLALPGGINYTTAAGDWAWVYADTLTQFDVQIFKKDGTAVVALPPSGLKSVQVFTASGTWTRPAGITKVEVIVTSGGGAGDGAGNDGGGAGATSIKVIDVSAISTSTLVVGAGGTGVGEAGGTSSWIDGTNTLSCTGGGSVATSIGGIATGGDVNTKGGDSGDAGSLGGASYWGGGGDDAAIGSGGAESGASDDGADGIIYIKEYA